MDFWVGKISPANAAALALAPFAISFYSTQVGQSSSGSISAYNVGSAPLSITGINFTGDFSQGSNSCPATMPAAASNCGISVDFAPTATGIRTGSMTIDYNDGAAKTAVVPLTGTGFNPSLGLGGTLDFGYVLVGKTSPSQTVPVQNRGNTLSITSIAATGDFQETNTCGSAIPTAASCNITITFAPTAAGPRTGSVTVTADAQGSPYVLSLTGNGVVGGLAVIAPASLTFGTQSVGTTSASQSVTLTNTGTANVSISGISPSGEFSQTNNCPIGSTLAPNASCTLSVTFSPKTAGTRFGAISIFDSSPNAPQIVQLTGAAIDWALGLAAGSSPSQTVAAGKSANYQLNVASLGFIGAVSLSCANAPPQANCSVSPSSVNFQGPGNAQIAVTVATTAHSFFPSDRWRFPTWPSGPRGLLVSAGTLLALVVSVLAPLARARTTRLRLAFAAGFLFAMLVAGCGGSGSSAPPTSNGTPTGTYTISVSGSAQGTTQAMNLTLVVQ